MLPDVNHPEVILKYKPSVTAAFINIFDKHREKFFKAQSHCSIKMVRKD
jgi:hypothetical protein